MDNKYFVSYSSSYQDYRLVCIGGEKERVKTQQNIDAHGSDEIILEVSEKEYDRICSNMEIKMY